MPTQVVEVDLQTDIGAIPVDTFSDLLVIATEPTVDDPTYGDPNVYDTVEQVATDFGTDSDAYEASQEIASKGVEAWWVVALETLNHTESFQPSTGEEISDGELTEAELDETPLKGGVENITADVDGTNLIVVPTVESPPSTPGTDELALNFDTGEFTLGDPIDDTQTLEIVYDTLDWISAEPEMSAGGFDLSILADTHADRSYIGELDTMVTWANDNEAAVIAAYENGDEYDSHEAAVDAAHDIGSYVPSGNLLPIAHRSSDDVAAGVAGRVATQKPWFDPFYDGGANYGFSMNNYRESLIGSPDKPNTFEGGRGENEAAGPCNVLHRMEGTQVLTNSLSTAGRASDYQFWDVKRTEAFVVNEVDRALRSLRLRQEHIPFSPSGKALIEHALKSNLLQYVSSGSPTVSRSELDNTNEEEEETQLERIADQHIGGGGSVDAKPLTNLEIHVPRFSDLPRSDRANRRWSGIVIEAQLAGNVHTFEVELAVHV